MLALIGGLSGVGKTTLLMAAQDAGILRITPVFTSREPRAVDPTRMPLSEMTRLELQPAEEFEYEYGAYVVPIPGEPQLGAADWYAMEYPGLYFRRTDFIDRAHVRIALAPPGEHELVDRLVVANRTHRVAEAIAEFRNEWSDLADGQVLNSWHVLVNMTIQQSLVRLRELLKLHERAGDS